MVTYNRMVVGELTDAEADRLFHALADATRRDILHRCIDEAPSVSCLAGVYPIYGVRSNVQGFVAHPTTQNVVFGAVRIGKA